MLSAATSQADTETRRTMKVLRMTDVKRTITSHAKARLAAMLMRELRLGQVELSITSRVNTISSANAAVGALPTNTRVNSRSGAGQPIASEAISTLERMVARMAKAIPPPVRISPNCK